MNQYTLYEHHPCAFYGCGGETYEIGKYESVADARAAAEGRTDAVIQWRPVPCFNAGTMYGCPADADSTTWRFIIKWDDDLELS
ncbi:hypothetical protein ACFRAQ_05600 [Nocardia sp. NPDC056611]|uniref:hypothetical protein n=1 Tax=Nocardia sp. NPDC056611 TaxID=3345877 RepID=UPI00366E02A9